MVITNEGMGTTAKLMTADVGETAYDYIGIGTGTTGASASDTWLETEDQVSAATGTTITTTQSDDTMQLVVDAFSFGSSKAITEAIIANAGTDVGGECLARWTFSAMNVTSSDELKVTATVQVKQGS